MGDDEYDPDDEKEYKINSDALADSEHAHDDEFEPGDGNADTTAVVMCPYCGESNDIMLDPGGGETQEYVEDCQVCCQPWQMVVTYHANGTADVYIERSDGG